MIYQLKYSLKHSKHQNKMIAFQNGTQSPRAGSPVWVCANLTSCLKVYLFLHSNSFLIFRISTRLITNDRSHFWCLSLLRSQEGDGGLDKKPRKIPCDCVVFFSLSQASHKKRGWIDTLQFPKESTKISDLQYNFQFSLRMFWPHCRGPGFYFTAEFVLHLWRTYYATSFPHTTSSTVKL